MKNKFFTPFVVTEFICFAMLAFTSMAPIGVDPLIFRLICIGLATLYATIMVAKSALDKWSAIAFSVLSLGGECFLSLSKGINLEMLGNIFYALAFVVVFLRLLIERKKGLILKGSLFLVLSICLFFIFRLFTSMAVPYSIMASALLMSIVLSIIEYNKAEAKNKPNWFFLAVGCFFFLIYETSLVGNPYVADTAGLKSLIELCEISFFLPGIVMTTISFMLFEPRAS